MAKSRDLTKLADDVRAIYRVEHVLTLGDPESLSKRHGLQPHVVGDVINAMTALGRAPGARRLRTQYKLPGTCPSLDDQFDDHCPAHQPPRIARDGGRAGWTTLGRSGQSR